MTVTLDLITVIDNDDAEEDFSYNPGEKSNVYFELILIDPEATRDWQKWSIENYNGEGGGYDYEHENGFMDYTIMDLLPDDIEEGRYTMEGFYMTFHTDYWGEVDCDFYCDTIRPATEEEIKDWLQ